jgi:signal transduction histidine kinase
MRVSSGITLLLLSLFILISAGDLIAATPVMLGKGFTEISLAEHIEILEDRSRKLTITDMASEKVSEMFLPSTEGRQNFGYTPSAYWVRFTIKNTSGQTIKWYLEVGYHFLDSIELFIPLRYGGYRMKKGGDLLPFKEREIAYRNFIFQLEEPPDGESTYFIRFETTSSMIIPLTIWSQRSLIEKINREQIIFGVYYGAMLIMLIYNLFLYASIRERTYLYYVLFISGYILFQMSLNGLAFQYLWPDNVWWENKGITYFINFTVFFILQFTRSFLNTSDNNPILDRVLLYLSLLTIGGFVFYPLLNSAWGIHISNLFAFFCIVTVILSGVVSMLKGNRSARYLLIAWTAFLLGAALFILKLYAFFPEIFITEWGIQVGSVMLVVLLSLGLADVINTLKKSKESYARELEKTNIRLERFNVDLEQQVSERTKELSKAYRKLMELDKMKTEFLSTVSHELRTPLTSVLGFARIIKKKLESTLFPSVNRDNGKIQRAIEQVGKNIDIIIAESERLTLLINNILDIAKMEAGKIEWKSEPVSIADIIQRSTEATAPLFEGKRVELKIEIEDGLPEVKGDRDRLIQVLINLISNAAKFTDEGSVTVRAVRAERIRGAEQGKADELIQVSIADTGVGISEEDQMEIFEKFKQAGDTLTEKPKGTGLGLPICKQIVEYHGGVIWVESEPGKGSTFSFTLPVLKPANTDSSDG